MLVRRASVSTELVRNAHLYAAEIPSAGRGHVSPVNPVRNAVKPIGYNIAPVKGPGRTVWIARYRDLYAPILGIANHLAAGILNSITPTVVVTIGR